MGEKLKEYAQSKEAEREVEYWIKGRGKEVEELPKDKEGGSNKEREARRVVVEMGEEETEKLVKEVGKAYKTRMSEIVVAGIVEAIGEWSGVRRVRIEMEGHGREGIIEGGCDEDGRVVHEPVSGGDRDRRRGKSRREGKEGEGGDERGEEWRDRVWGTQILEQQQ